MEICEEILAGNYEDCYKFLIWNSKHSPDQILLKEFFELSQAKCFEMFKKNRREIELDIQNKFPSARSKESQLSKEKREKAISDEMIEILSEKLYSSLLFGSVIYSLSNYKLLQEKQKLSSLQKMFDSLQIECQKYKLKKKTIKQQCKTKEKIVHELKQKVQTLKQTFLPSQHQQNRYIKGQSLDGDAEQETKIINADSINNTPGMKRNDCLNKTSNQQNNFQSKEEMLSFSFGKILPNPIKKFKSVEITNFSGEVLSQKYQNNITQQTHNIFF